MSKALRDLPDDGLRSLDTAVAAEVKRRAKVEMKKKSPSDMNDAEFIQWARKQIEGDQDNE